VRAFFDFLFEQQLALFPDLQRMALSRKEMLVASDDT